MKVDGNSHLPRLFEWLLSLYPPRFRSEFAGEMRAVLCGLLCEAGEQRGAAWLVAVVREISGLAGSILCEQRREHQARKEQAMARENQIPNAASGGMPPLRLAGNPGALWLAGWTLLTTAAIPVALIVVAPLAVLFMGLLNLGARAGIWPAASAAAMQALGAAAGLALALSSAQWLLLRRVLPRAGLWFLATGAGVLLGSAVIGLLVGRSGIQSRGDVWIMAAVLLPLGLAIGLAQWLCLRRILPNAYWIILVDVLAAGSILLAGGTFTSLAELLVLVLPGVISGLGLLLLLRGWQADMRVTASKEASRRQQLQLPGLARFALGAALLVLLFFAGSWVYAVSQLALAKQAGIYATPQEAVIGKNSQGWGGAEVVRIEGVWAEPSQRDAQPHVWFGGGTVYLDRVPVGYDKAYYSAGSFFLRVREGWVHVPEGAFPEFIGWVMELYNLEGVRQFAVQP